ncbi:MAG TPA: hypothetical protein VGB92_20405 [Longimicrobium sp.]|jgi:hypothetical protein
MHLAACVLLLILTVVSGVTAIVNLLISVSETAPGTSTWAAVTRGAFLSRKHFTERGWRLRGRAIRFQLLTMALMIVLFLTCSEL